MKIGIFVVDVGENGGGLETYEVELIRALVALDQQNEYFIYCLSPGAVKAIDVDRENVVFRVLRPSQRWLSIPLSLPAQMLRDGIDFYHATMVPPPLSSKPYLMSVLCFSSWAHPEFFAKAVLRRLNFLLEIGIHKAHYLLCNSRNLLEDIQRKFSVAEERLAVTHLGVSPIFAPQPIEETKRLLSDAYGIDGRYLLFIGKNQERKNAIGVVRGYAAYREATGSDAKLVLVGRPPGAKGPIQETVQALDLQEQVVRLPYVPYRDLPKLYTGADMFLFPSFWEGFGLPVIESMACGTPVLTSNVTALPEVAGDAAVIVEPDSVEQITEGMIRIETDPAFRADLVARGFERKKAFSWENCARETLKYYGRMVSVFS